MNYLTVGAWLFLVAGGFQLLIGILAAFLGFPVGIVGLSRRTDQQMWGEPSEALLEDRVVRDLRTHHTIVIGGLLCGVGALQAAMAWFAVRGGEVWAVAALTVMGVLMAGWWIAMILQFTRASVNVSVFDVQPFVWVHFLLWLAAVAFSWIGLRSVPA